MLVTLDKKRLFSAIQRFVDEGEGWEEVGHILVRENPRFPHLLSSVRSSLTGVGGYVVYVDKQTDDIYTVFPANKDDAICLAIRLVFDAEKRVYRIVAHPVAIVGKEAHSTITRRVRSRYTPAHV